MFIQVPREYFNLSHIYTNFFLHNFKCLWIIPLRWIVLSSTELPSCQIKPYTFSSSLQICRIALCFLWHGLIRNKNNYLYVMYCVSCNHPVLAFDPSGHYSILCTQILPVARHNCQSHADQNEAALQRAVPLFSHVSAQTLHTYSTLF